jgi:hypothetical protein
MYIHVHVGAGDQNKHSYAIISFLYKSPFFMFLYLTGTSSGAVMGEDSNGGFEEGP